MMGFGFLFMLALIALPVFLVVVRLPNSAATNNTVTSSTPAGLS